MSASEVLVVDDAFVDITSVYNVLEEMFPVELSVLIDVGTVLLAVAVLSDAVEVVVSATVLVVEAVKVGEGTAAAVVVVVVAVVVYAGVEEESAAG